MKRLTLTIVNGKKTILPFEDSLLEVETERIATPEEIYNLDNLNADYIDNQTINEPQSEDFIDEPILVRDGTASQFISNLPNKVKYNSVLVLGALLLALAGFSINKGPSTPSSASKIAPTVTKYVPSVSDKKALAACKLADGIAYKSFQYAKTVDKKDPVICLPKGYDQTLKFKALPNQNEDGGTSVPSVGGGESSEK